MATLLLSACSSPKVVPEVPPTYRLDVKYYSATNDLKGGFATGTELATLYEKLIPADDGQHKSLGLPLDYAVECNPARTSCQHGVVKPTFNYSVKKIGHDYVIRAVFTSTSQKKAAIGGDSGYIKRSVAEGVPVLTSETETYDVEMNSTSERVYEFTARTGNKLVAKIVEEKEIY